MKKLLLIALMALSVSVAQAATSTWSNTSFTDATLSVNITSTSTALITMTLPSSDAPGFIGMTLSSTTSYMRVYLRHYSFDGNSIRFYTVDNGAYVINSVTPSIDYSDGVGFAFLLSRNGDTSSLSFYCNGTVLAEWDNITTFTASDAFSSIDIGVDAGVTKAEVYVAETTDDIIAEYTAIAASYIVPEPTILALLALGVAGIALKRRM